MFGKWEEMNMKDNKKSVWIWYPGDFEIYHGMLQNFQREERGYGWPAYWKMDDWRKNMRFFRTYDLEKETSFKVFGHGQGHVKVNEVKYPFETEIKCEPGECKVEVFIGNMTGLPCAYVEGDVIFSGKDWLASDFVEEHPVGTSSLYVKKEPTPNEISYEVEVCEPVCVKEMEGGVLFEFGRVVNGTLKVTLSPEKAPVTVCYGESVQEALDQEWCYYKSEQVISGETLRRRAFRYVFVPDSKKEEVCVTAQHQYVPIEVKASFHCNDDVVNRIWEVSKETFRLCSGLFFIDGIKRDRWIWSGDAYQNYFVNPYLFFDEEINKRTILALRGNQEIVQHINTIVDYSLLWLISIEREYWMTGEKAFVEMVYPKMEGLMKLCRSQLDEHGFIYGRKQDWIFIDWSDMDKSGVIAAEQMLLLKCYDTMAFCGKLLGLDVTEYEKRFEALKENIFRYFWDEEKGAFIDCFTSGKRHVTRHANIFAILFDLVDETQTESILENVLLNPEITEITTPYFKFFELDVWGKTGHLDKVYTIMKDYWGGMLEKGALTFWEEYTPRQGEPEQYGMYGDPFGKSLCHAWAASPIYLLGRYFLGVYPLSPGYETFAVEPKTEYFTELDCTVPVKDGKVRICFQNGELKVEADSEETAQRIRK